MGTLWKVFDNKTDICIGIFYRYGIAVDFVEYQATLGNDYVVLNGGEMDFDYFVNELKRTFGVLSVCNAEIQNEIDIKEWFNHFYISFSEKKRLLKLNHKMAKMAKKRKN